MTMPLPPTHPSRAPRTPAGLFFTTLALLALLALLTLAACSSTAASGGTARANGGAPAANGGSGSSAVSTRVTSPTAASTRVPGATAPTSVPTRPAATSTPRPPTPRPAPTATPAPSGGCGIYYLCNPWRYTFVCCQNVYLQMVGAPTAPQFCALFNCNITFYANNGAIVQCGDGTFTRTSGIGKDSNTCTSGGTRRPLLYCPPVDPICQQP